jgi:hypothetical protein
MSFIIVVAKVTIVKDIVLHDYNRKKNHLKYDLVMDWGLALCLTFVTTLEVPNKLNKKSPN